jgi:hypothetical protein
MFDNEAKNNARVWVRIGQGDSAPIVPGMITDNRVGPRELLRSAAKGGTLVVQNSVVVISLRENVTPGNGRPAVYYTERPEALIALSPRTGALIPAIDGDGKQTTTDILNALRIQVALSRAALAPAPDKAKGEEEAKRFLAVPALTFAKTKAS